MARKGQSIKGGVVEESDLQDKIVKQYHVLELEDLKKGETYYGFKTDSEGNVAEHFQATITEKNISGGVLKFEVKIPLTNDDRFYISEEGFFFSDTLPGEGGRRKRKLKRSTRRKHL